MSMFEAQMLGYAMGAGQRADRNYDTAVRNYEAAERNRVIAEHNFGELQKANAEIRRLQDLCEKLDMGVCKYDTYYRGALAQRDSALDYIDTLIGDASRNPYRAPAYPDDAAQVMPVGPRKGQVITALDRIGLSAMFKTFKASYADHGMTFWAFLKRDFEIDQD